MSVATSLSPAVTSDGVFELHREVLVVEVPVVERVVERDVVGVREPVERDLERRGLRSRLGRAPWLASRQARSSVVLRRRRPVSAGGGRLRGGTRLLPAAGSREREHDGDGDEEEERASSWRSGCSWAVSFPSGA